MAFVKRLTHRSHKRVMHCKVTESFADETYSRLREILSYSREYEVKYVLLLRSFVRFAQEKLHEPFNARDSLTV